MVNETRPPTVIGEHWIDHLDSEGRIAKCKPHNFKFEDKWLPLYTRAGVTKQVSGLGSLLNTQGDSPLIAVIPPDMSFQYEQEYVIHQLHKAKCLAWVSIYYGKNQRKQIAFCPYCGIMNENSATAYSHARKSRDNLPQWRLLRQDLQGTAAPLPPYEELPPMPHEQAGGFSMKWEEKVARLLLPPLAHREWTAALASEALLVWRPLVSFDYRDPWSLSIMETPGLLFIV